MAKANVSHSLVWMIVHGCALRCFADASERKQFCLRCLSDKSYWFLTFISTGESCHEKGNAKMSRTRLPKLRKRYTYLTVGVVGVGCWLLVLVVGCWLLVVGVGCWLLVVGCWCWMLQERWRVWCDFEDCEIFW